MAETVELTLPDDKKPPVDKPPVDKPPAEAPPRGVDLADLVRASEPPPDVTAGLTDLKRQELAAKEKTYQTIEGQTSRDQARAEAAYKKSAGADLSAIKPWDAQQAGKDYHTDPLEAFGSLGSVFAIFASAFTHQPMENALLGSAAAMGAIKNGDDVAYDRAYTAWKDNTQLALKNHQIQHETYQDAIQLMNTNMGAGRVKMQVDAARFGDKQALFLLENGMDKELIELQQSRMKSAATLAEKWQKIEEDNAKLQTMWQLEKEKLAEGKSPGQARLEAWKEVHNSKAGNAGASKEERIQQDAQDLADGIIAGLIDPNLTGFYTQKAPTEAILARRRFDLAKSKLEWAAASRQVASLNSAQMVRFTGLASSVINTVDEVKALSEKMRLSGVPSLNRLELAAYIQTQGNSEKGQLAARYLAAANTLKEEIANVAQGGYAPTESAWKLAASQVNEGYGWKEMAASLDTVQRLLRIRVASIPGLSTVGPSAPNRYRPQDKQQEDFGGWR